MEAWGGAGATPPAANLIPMRRPSPLAVVVALLAVLAVASPAVGGPSPHGPQPIDHVAEDCDEFVPASVADPAVAPGGDEVVLEVEVLLDGVTRIAAEGIMVTAAESYAPLDITVAATFRRLSPPSETPGGPADPDDLIDAAKAVYGGARPETADVVYVLTDKDLVEGGDSGVAGSADCIGGIRYPERAFAVGEAAEDVVDLGLQFYVDGPAKIAAHEIGHLLGAHHHYANCVQGAGLAIVTGRDAGICTLMINSLDVQGLHFGTLEAMVVRGHAEDYATP